MLKASQIAQLINEVYDGVERSKIGNMYQLDNEGNRIKSPEGYFVYNPFAYQSFLKILDAAFPKNIGMSMKEDFDAK